MLSDLVHHFQTSSMNKLLPSLSDEAVLWVWIADRRLQAAEQEHLLSRLELFLGSWTTHGKSVRGDATILEDQVLLIGGEVDAGEISGCGIDKSVHVIEDTGREIGSGWLAGLTIAFRRPGASSIETATRSDFKRMARTGEVDASTLVYDRTTTNLGKVRAAGIARPASDTWTARYFSPAAQAAGDRAGRH